MNSVRVTLKHKKNWQYHKKVANFAENFTNESLTHKWVNLIHFSLRPHSKCTLQVDVFMLAMMSVL